MNSHFHPKSISLFALLLVLFLAFGWVLPNHYPPWLAFHANACVGFALLLICIRGINVISGRVVVTRGGLLLVALACIPWVQHIFGLLPLVSDAALTSLCLLGAACAYIVAKNWSAHDFLKPAYYVLGAMAVAAVISSGLATYQWLGLAGDVGLTEVWILPFSEGTRPYANMGQPNQLASLLLCGLFGVALATIKRSISPFISIILAAWILWGVALTESRTALLSLLVFVGFVSFKRPGFLAVSEVRVIQGALVFYLACLFGKSLLAKAFGEEIPLSMIGRSAGELRLSLWKMSLEASLVSPWYGFGWGRSVSGYFYVFEEYKEIFNNTFFAQSHNIILDLALWVGWPLTILISGLGFFWISKRISIINSKEQLAVAAAMLSLLIHAMLEFPLHYGYFFWPFFFLMGSLSVSVNENINGWVILRKKLAIGLMVALSVVGLVVMVDYLRIEQSFQDLRFKIARIGTGHDETLPKTYILTDWPDVIALTRDSPTQGMSEEKIDRWEALMLYHPSPLAIRKIIGANKLNGKDAEARAWSSRICWMLNEKACAGLYEEWTLP